jgi:hypothetical protein
MLGSANMKPAAPMPRPPKDLVVLALAYLPFLAWSLIGAGWTLVHHPFTLWFTGAWLLVVIHSLIFKRTIGGATLMTAIAACHLMTAFALHTWLQLPIWTVPVFLVASIALMVAVRMRAASAHFRLTKPRPGGQ